ncbi:hypothetical protein NKH77_24645 [Streptomyces sp. M19]
MHLRLCWYEAFEDAVLRAEADGSLRQGMLIRPIADMALSLVTGAYAAHLDQGTDTRRWLIDAWELVLPALAVRRHPWRFHRGGIPPVRGRAGRARCLAPPALAPPVPAPPAPVPPTPGPPPPVPSSRCAPGPRFADGAVRRPPADRYGGGASVPAASVPAASVPPPYRRLRTRREEGTRWRGGRRRTR